jgi:hypothetical protein
MTYQWHDQNGPIIGQTGTSLTLAGLTARSYSYFCAVTTVAAGTANSGTTRLQVFNTAPTWPSPALAATSATSRLPLPGAKVSQPYSYQVPLPGQTVITNLDGTVTASGTANGAAAPSSFRATGLPAGLTINSAGQITGAATVDGTFNVTITMTNGITPAPAPLFATLVITPINANVIGEFTGPIERHPLNGNLGGMVSVKTTKNGAYTGRVTMGALSYGFKGALVSGAGGPNPVATVTISRGRTLPALVMNFALDAATQLVSVGEIKEITDRLSSNVATFTGWRYSWLKSTVNPTPALAYSGYYTLGLELPLLLQGNASIPQGTGYASFTVNSGTGRATVSGRLSDGTAFTTATYVGPTGEMLVFGALYAANARGSVLGSLDIDQLTPSNLDDNRITGTVSWFKPAQAGRSYAAGFGPFDMEAVGSRYNPPATGVPVMSIAPPTIPGQVNALVELTGGNVETAAPITTVPAANQTGFSVTTTNSAVADVVNNPRKMTLVITSRTGVISGRFALSGAHPFASSGGTPATINRTVNYLGLIINNGSLQQGWGYFLLPQMPSNAAEKMTATPILSGQAVFEKLP